MMKVVKVLCLCIATILSSCGEKDNNPGGPCGNSFCINKPGGKISKNVSGVDFDTYSYAANGKKFVIYEGNNPRISSRNIDEFSYSRDKILTSYQRSDEQVIAVLLLPSGVKYKYLAIYQDCAEGACDIEEAVSAIRVRLN